MSDWQRCPAAPSGGALSSRRLIGALALVVVTATCLGVTKLLSSVSRAAHPLWIKPAELDFGEIWAQRDFRWSIHVQNRGSETVTVSDVFLSCGCQGTVRPRSFAVPAGQRREVQLTLDLIAPEAAAGAERRVSLPIVFRLSEDMGVARFVLRGTVRDALKVAPRVIQFGQSLQEGGRSRGHRLTVQALVPLKTLQAEVHPPIGTVCIRRRASNERGYGVTFSPAANLPPGPLAAVLQLHGVTEDGQRIPPYPVPIEGTVVADIRAVPERLDLGVRIVGELAEGTVVLQSLAGRSFAVTRVSLCPPEKDALSATVEPPAEQAAAIHRLHVRLRVRRGHNDALMRVSVRCLESLKPRIMEIPINAYGYDSDSFHQRQY